MGNRELLRRGATAFPTGWLPGKLHDTLRASSKDLPPAMETADLFAALALHESPPEYRGTRKDAVAKKGK